MVHWWLWPRCCQLFLDHILSQIVAVFRLQGFLKFIFVIGTGRGWAAFSWREEYSGVMFWVNIILHNVQFILFCFVLFTFPGTLSDPVSYKRTGWAHMTKFQWVTMQTRSQVYMSCCRHGALSHVLLNEEKDSLFPCLLPFLPLWNSSIMHIVWATRLEWSLLICFKA